MLLVGHRTQEFRKLDPRGEEATGMLFHKVRDVAALPDMRLSV